VEAVVAVLLPLLAAAAVVVLPLLVEPAAEAAWLPQLEVAVVARLPRPEEEARLPLTVVAAAEARPLPLEEEALLPQPAVVVEGELLLPLAAAGVPHLQREEAVAEAVVVLPPRRLPVHLLWASRERLRQAARPQARAAS